MNTWCALLKEYINQRLITSQLYMIWFHVLPKLELTYRHAKAKVA